MNSLTLYENAKRALAEYESVDEVKEYRDKALAVEAYAKQASDTELERMAAIARVRAERRCGELLGEMELAKGSAGAAKGRDSSGGTVLVPPENDAPTLPELGLTKKQSSQFQAIARVPEEEFEAAVKVEGAKPSGAHIAQKQITKERQARGESKPEPQKMDPDALKLWGVFRELERHDMNRAFKELRGEMTAKMRSDLDRIVPNMIDWINKQ